MRSYRGSTSLEFEKVKFRLFVATSLDGLTTISTESAQELADASDDPFDKQNGKLLSHLVFEDQWGGQRMN